ncbi:hypothetical protein LEM8419_01570 [Neolewinella maritima]|uniref:DUF547 domain-containing protein n=1 Tax=Neolewinella maritima TaxID=1383882 RepID=A0ABM9B000_9BACT|nr:DUF547 domain-containing protein [Neolewinella maritima]CAH1000417.1 hypothetical protein LEM8419_01570 [Neolewinella maritima]
MYTQLTSSLHLLLVLSLSLSLCRCADGPPATTSAAVATAPTVNGQPIATDTVASDQIEYTLEQNPGIATAEPSVKEAQIEVARAKPATPKPVAPPAPTNTAPAPAPAPPAAPAVPAARPASNAPNHSAWNDLLQQHVAASGRVDYQGFQQDEPKLDDYLGTLARETPGPNWSRQEALAYWINAYNAYTIKLILDNDIPASIRDIEKPWDQRWIKLAGKTYSLNQIEHDIVRPTFKEPRIHFALVCAAKSCPPLPNQAFTAENLEQLLERRTRAFIRDEERNVTQEAVVRVSPLFDWYAEDFGNVKDYLNKYLATEIPASKEITFLDYDWSLNN